MTILASRLPWPAPGRTASCASGSPSRRARVWNRRGKDRRGRPGRRAGLRAKAARAGRSRRASVHGRTRLTNGRHMFDRVGAGRRNARADELPVEQRRAPYTLTSETCVQANFLELRKTGVQIPRIHLPRARVNRNRKEGRSVAARSRVASRAGRPPFYRSTQSCGRTMNHSTNSVHRFSSSKRNVHRFQKKSPFA
jgi:hypothetical protein